MSEMETDEIRPEDIYKPNDIVWVKISGMWWPAEVCDQKKLDPEVTEGLKKQPLAVVKFLQEDVYEFIRDFDLINHYYCKKKWDFLKSGFKKYRKLKNEANVALFPSSVQEAERRTGGDPNIINHPELAEEPAVTPKNKSISVKPTSTPITHSRETRPKKPVRTVHLPQPELVEKKGWSWYPYPKYIGHSFSPRKRNEPHHPPAYIHRCSLCAFETTQLEILVWHHKMDQHRWGHTGKWVNVGPPQITEAVESPKEDKKIVKKTKPKKKKQLPPPVGQSTPAPKKKKKDEPPAVLETSHLAEEISKEWGDEIEDEIGSHVDQDGDLSEIDTQKTIPVTLDHSESQNDEEPSRVTETAANKTSSCFDFDEEEPAEPTLQSLKFGQKLPRVITPEKSKPTKESMADSVTDDLELEGFLKDVAVPEIPNIPIAKLGSPTKETGFSRGDRSYGRSPFCDSPRRVEHQEEQSIQNSSEDGTSGKNEHSTNNKHFLAKGPLQSKRKSFGHTEGAEDGSVTKKRIESCGSHKPSSKCDDQSRASIKLKLFQPMPEEGSAALNSTAEDTSSPQAEDQATNKRQTRSGSGETQTPIIKSKGAGSEMRDNKVIRDDNGSSLRYSGNFACSNGEVIAANDEGLCEEGIKVSQLNNQDLKGIDTLQQLSGLTSVLHVKSPSVASTLPGDEVDDLILHVSSEEAFENERPREPILAESIVNSQQPLESESEVPRNVVDSTPKSSQSFARKSKRTSSSLVADKTQKNKLSLHEEVIETASGKSSIKTEMKVQSEVLAALSDTKVCEAGEDSKPEIRRSRRSSTKPTPEDTEVVNEKKGEKLLPEKTGKGKVKPSIDLTKNEVAKSSSVKRRRSVEERLADAMVDNGDRVESENKSRKTRKTSHSPERLRNKNESLSKKEEKPRRGRSDVKPLNEQSSPAPNIDSGAALSPLESDVLLDTPRERVATFASDHIALRRERSSRSHKSPQRNVSSNKRPSSSSFEQKDKSKIGKSRNKDVSLLTSHPGDGANHVEKPLAVSDSSSSKHTRNSKSSKSPRTDVTPKSQPPVSTSCEAKLRRGRSDDAKTPDKSDHVNHSTSPVGSKSNKYSRREKERSTSIDGKPRRGRSDDHKSHDSSTPQLDTRSKFKKSIPGDSMAKKSEQPVSNVIDKPQSRVISEDRDISNRILIEPSTQQSTQQDEPSVVTSSSASELSLTNDGTPKKARSSKSSKSPMKENVAAAIIQPPSASIDGEHVHQKTPLEIHDSKPPMDINLLREDVNSKSKSPLNRQESKDRSLDHFEVPDSTPEIDSAVTLSSAEVRPGSTVETGLTDLQVELSAEMVPSNLLPEIKTPKKEKSDELEKLEACGEDGNTLIMNDTKPARWLDDKKTPVKENSKIPISNSMASTPTHALLTGGSDSLKDEKNNGMAQFETALTENFPEIPPPADNCAVDLHDSVVVEPSLRASSKVDNMSVEKSLDDPNVSDCTLTSAVQPAKPGGDQSGLTKTPVKIGPVRNDPQRGAAQPTPSKHDHAARGRIQSDSLENILAHSSPISPPGSSPNQKGASVSVKFPEELGNHEAISKQDAKKPVASPIKLVGESQVSSAIEPLNATEAPGIASIKSSRWDSPFPVKKSEGRSTPLSPMRSPTKSPLSPVGKVKVEIKSGLGRACFKSPPRINLEDALSPKPPRIGSDAASPLEDEFSALQAEIQAYTSPAKEVDKVPEANFSEKKTAVSLDCKSLSDIKDDLQSLEDVLKTPPVSRSLSPTKPADVVQSLPLECIPLPPDPPKSVVSAQQVPGLTETTLLLNDDVNGRSIKEEIVESSSASDASPSPTKKPPSTPKITPITVPPDTPASGPADVKVLSSQYVGNCQPSQCGFTDALNMELDISNMPVVFGDEEDLLFSETTAEESIEDSLIEEISEPQVKTTTKTAPSYVAPPNPWDGKLVIKEVEGPLVVESRKLSCVVFDVYPVGHPEFDYYMSLPGISPCPPDVRYPEASEEGSKVVDVDALEETNCQLPKVNVQPKVAVTPKVLQSSKLVSLGTKTVPMKQPINKAFLTGAPTAKMVRRSNVLPITNPVKITMDSKMVKASDMNAVGKQSSKLKIFSRSGKFHFEEVSPKKVDGGKATVMARQPTASSASISAVTSRARGRLSAPPAGRAALQIHAGRSIPHILTASKKTADKKISITRNASAKSGQKIQLLPKNQIKFVRTINSVPASSNMSILIEKKPPAAVPMVTPGSDILAQALLDTNLEPSDTMPTADIFVTTTPQPVIYAHLPTFINAGPSSAVSSTSESVKR